MSTSSTITRAGFSVAETAQALGISTSAVYQAIRAGDIRAARVGGKVYVPSSWFSEEGLDVPA